MSKKYKFACCTQPPWKHLIPKIDRENIAHKIRQETIEIYGEHYDSCIKRHFCIKNECLGRPLPMKSKTAKEYLEILKRYYRIKNGELFIDNCSTCSLASGCSSTCYQVNDFLNRHKEKQIQIIFKESVDNAQVEEGAILTNSGRNINIDRNNIPWDVLPKKKRNILKKYLFEYKNFSTIAKECKYLNRATSKQEFYYAMNKLSEFAVMREFINNNKNKLTKKQKSILIDIYINNKTRAEVAKKLDVSKQAVQQQISRVVQEHGISWDIFVKRVKGKLKYFVPEVFK